MSNSSTSFEAAPDGDTNSMLKSLKDECSKPALISTNSVNPIFVSSVRSLVTVVLSILEPRPSPL